MTVLIFALILFPAWANVPQAPAAYTIAGVVVDAVTGAPVPRAEL